MTEKINNQNGLREDIESFKKILHDNDLLPVGLHFYKEEKSKINKGLKRNTDTFCLNMTFDNEEHFYKWKHDIRKIDDLSKVMYKAKQDAKSFKISKRSI